MVTILAIVVFIAVALLLALGVIFGKRTPLKGSCHGGGASGGGVCESCTCGIAGEEDAK